MATKEELCNLAGVSGIELDGGSCDLTLTGDVVESLPDGLKLHGLTLNGCASLKALPEDIDIKYLSLLECPGITHLPENLVLDQLYLFVSDIDELPVNSSCWKELVLINCRNIKRLPEACTAFAGDLYLEGCTGLTSLPDIKIVYGNLNVSWTSIRNLPEGIIVGGNLDLIDSEMESLPLNMRVGGDVCLQGCGNIKSLPDGMVVNGNLDIRSTSIKELPVDLIVGGDIIADDSQVESSNVREELPANLSETVWRNSGYIHAKGRLYRIIEHKDGYWKVMEAVLDVYRMKTGSDDVYDDFVLYVVKDSSSNYGVGRSLDDAYRDLNC